MWMHRNNGKRMQRRIYLSMKQVQMPEKSSCSPLEWNLELSSDFQDYYVHQPKSGTKWHQFTNTPTNFMNTCTYQSRINSKCLSTALSCVIQSPLPCICASKIWPCIAEVWSQLETLIENERWEPFIFNRQKSTELARTGSSRRLQTWIHKENTRSFEDHITCPLECRVKIPQKWKLWRWGMEDRGSWLEHFLKKCSALLCL